MKKIAFKFFFLLCFFLISNNVSAEILKKIEISGNKRISNETIKVYGDIQINKNYQEDEINDVIKKLYSTNFFSNVSTSFSNGVLRISVGENPIIYSIDIKGEETKKYKDASAKLVDIITALVYIFLIPSLLDSFVIFLAIY